MILKDRFLTQSAPDISRKLLIWAYGPNQSLDNLLQLAQTVYYGRKYEEKKKRQKKTKEKAEAFAMAINSLRKMPRGAQVKRDGLAITVERRGTSSGIALRHLSRPGSMSSLQRTTLEERLPPRGVGLQGQTLKTIRTEGARGSPHKLPS